MTTNNQPSLHTSTVKARGSMTGDVVAPSSKHAVLFYAHYNLVLEKKNPTHSPLTCIQTPSYKRLSGYI